MVVYSVVLSRSCLLVDVVTGHSIASRMSSAELTATEEADMADCDGDKVVTMMDVLQEQEDFEEDANAVLGASDEKNCTYPKGYIKRQALYACLTCCADARTDPTKRAGVCLACSLSCHENHELVELYTKRNFCCDCGNSKFGSHPCQFTSNKPDLNDNNSYNQNFSGLYCVCHRPYPDPEATFEDEMIQCIVCEDWLHASHLEAKVPPNEQYSEMICKGCMETNEFLYDYSDLAVNAEAEDVDVITVNEKVNGVCNGDSEKHDLKSNTNEENGDVDMADVPSKPSDNENKVEDTINGTSKESSESIVKTDVESTENAQMEVEATKDEQKSDENETAEQNDDSENVQKTSNNDDLPHNDTSDQENNKNLDNADGDTTPDKPVESKPEEQSTEDKENISTDEQNSSITEKLDSKTDENTDSDERVEKTTEGDKLEPDSSEPTQNVDGATEVTKDAENNTSQSEKEPNEKTDNKQDESLEKDDLMESIDRIINGDDDKSSTEKDEKTTDSCQEKTSNDENIDEVKNNENTDEVKNDENTDETKNDEVKSHSEEKVSTEDNENKEIALNREKSDENQPQTDVDMDEKTPNIDDSTKPNDTEVEPKDNKRKLDENTIDKTDIKKPKLDTSSCKRPTGVKRRPKGATFWTSSFREKLCTCNECLTMYKDLSVLFLIDLEDTVSAYETLGKERNDGRSSQYEIGLQALSSLDRIQQINALTEYNKMRDKLLDFLKSFKDRKEVVKEEDIKAFFAGMKPKREPDGVYFCR